MVRVPYVGSPGAKTRPALIVQADPLHALMRETIIVPITSNLVNVHQPFQFFVDISTPDGAATGLLTNSAVRCERLHTVPQADIRNTIGNFSDPMMEQIEARLKSALGMT